MLDKNKEETNKIDENIVLILRVWLEKNKEEMGMREIDKNKNDL